MLKRPYGSYLFLTATYWAVLFGVILLARASRRPLPERFAARDLMALGFATYRLSHLIASERVTRFIRTPFTRTTRVPGEDEGTREVPRGRGLQRALGELVTCPWCLGVWIGALLSYAMVLAPRASRLFILAMAVAGVGQLAEEAFGVLHRASREGIVVTHAPETEAVGQACVTCGQPLVEGRKTEAA